MKIEKILQKTIPILILASIIGVATAAEDWTPTWNLISADGDWATTPTIDYWESKSLPTSEKKSGSAWFSSLKPPDGYYIWSYAFIYRHNEGIYYGVDDSSYTLKYKIYKSDQTWKNWIVRFYYIRYGSNHPSYARLLYLNIRIFKSDSLILEDSQWVEWMDAEGNLIYDPSKGSDTIMYVTNYDNSMRFSIYYSMFYVPGGVWDNIISIRDQEFTQFSENYYNKMDIRPSFSAYWYKGVRRYESAMIEQIPSPPPPTGGGGCPVWSVWNNKLQNYEVVKSLGIHSERGVDVTQVDKYAVTAPFTTNSLRIKLEEPAYFAAEGSTLDYVGINVDGVTGTLVSAVHSRLGDVTLQLLKSDDLRIELKPGESLELTFQFSSSVTVDTVEITVEGYNPWEFPVKLTPLPIKIAMIIALVLFIALILDYLRKR